MSRRARWWPSRSRTRSLLGVVALTVVFVLPAFLTGALVLQIRQDIPVRASEFGLAAAAFFAVSALGAPWLGGLAQHLGPARSFRLAGSLAAVTYLGIGLVASTWFAVLGFLAFAGVSNALGQAAGNQAISELVTTRRGLAFGSKQAAIPISTLLAGFAVSVTGPLIGWRATFTVIGVLSLAITAVVTTTWPDRPMAARAAPTGDPRPRFVRLGPLVVLSLGGCLAAAAVNAYGVFVIDAAVFHGWAEVRAGQLLVGASIVAAATRIGMGWMADRHSVQGMTWVAAMMLLGGSGFMVLVLAGNVVVAFGVATVVAFAAGWGWPGLFHYSVVREHPLVPARATGIVQSGVWTGGVLGPVAFGFMVQGGSYRSAFAAAAAVLLAGSIAVATSRAMYRRSEPLVS